MSGVKLLIISVEVVLWVCDVVWWGTHMKGTHEHSPEPCLLLPAFPYKVSEYYGVPGVNPEKRCGSRLCCKVVMWSHGTYTCRKCVYRDLITDVVSVLHMPL